MASPAVSYSEDKVPRVNSPQNSDVPNNNATTLFSPDIECRLICSQSFYPAPLSKGGESTAIMRKPRRGRGGLCNISEWGKSKAPFSSFFSSGGIFLLECPWRPFGSNPHLNFSILATDSAQGLQWYKIKHQYWSNYIHALQRE